MSEYDTANEHELCFQIGKLKRRIADLSQALGLITTLKPTMVMDANHPLEMAKEVVEYVTARIAELEAENERLSQLLHDEMSQLEIATDLGNKRCAALNKIYEDGEKHNTNWCKRIAQEGLGIKMPEELYTSRDFCELAEKFEELKRENEELVSDKTYLINAAMDGGDKYHYTAHDIAYRDLERKCKALEAENAAMKKDLKARIAELEAKNNRLVELAEGLADMVDWSGCDCDKPYVLTEWEEFIAGVQE